MPTNNYGKKDSIHSARATVQKGFLFERLWILFRAGRIWLFGRWSRLGGRPTLILARIFFVPRRRFVVPGLRGPSLFCGVRIPGVFVLPRIKEPLRSLRLSKGRF